MIQRHELPPDAFAVVMATGIVSIAARDHRYDVIDRSLLVTAAAAFVVLCVGTAWGILSAPRQALTDARSPEVALSAFAFVAACAVLAARLTQHRGVTVVLVVAATLGWLVLAPLAIADVSSRPMGALRQQAHGGWLLPSVGTAGLAISAADLAAHHAWDGWVVLATAAWIVAMLLYCVITGLILARARSARLTPKEVTPDSWILMGALAIGALAGAKIVTALHATASMHPLLPTARTATLLVWTLASAWIPVLLYAEMWSVDHRRAGLRFGRVWWAAVFPLGMYATATQAVAGSLDLPALHTVSLVLFWDSFAVWTLVALGLIHWSVSTFAQRAVR